MTTVRDMLARREAIRVEFRSIQAQTPSGDLPADAAARWTALEGELRSLDQMTSRQATLDDLDRRSGTGQPLAADPRFEAHRAPVAFMDVVRAQVAGADDVAAGRAREVSQEIARRSGKSPNGMYFDMRAPQVEQRVTSVVTPNQNGATLVATNLDSSAFIDRLRNRLVVQALGARVLSDLTANLDIPRRTGSVTAGWIAEGQSLTYSDQSFDKVSLRPHHLGAITRLTRNFVMMATPDAQQLTADDMARQLAEAVDIAALVGTGTNNQPLGIVPQIPAANTFTYPKSPGGALSWANVLSLLTALETSNVTDPIAWVEGVGTRAALMATPKSTVASSSADFIQVDPASLAGAPAVVSHFLPAGSLLAGDWSDVLIGMWGTLDVLANPFISGAYEAGSVDVRCLMTVDVQPRHSASFAIITQATS